MAASCEASCNVKAAWMAQQVSWSEDRMYELQRFAKLGESSLLLEACHICAV